MSSSTPPYPVPPYAPPSYRSKPGAGRPTHASPFWSYHRTDGPAMEGESDPENGALGPGNDPDTQDVDEYGQNVDWGNWDERQVPHRMRERAEPGRVHSHLQAIQPADYGSTPHPGRLHGHPASETYNQPQFDGFIQDPSAPRPFLREPGAPYPTYMPTDVHSHTRLGVPSRPSHSRPGQHGAQRPHYGAPYPEAGGPTLGDYERDRRQRNQDFRVGGQISVPALQERYASQMIRVPEDGTVVTHRTVSDQASTSASSASRQHNDSQAGSERRCAYCRVEFPSKTERLIHYPDCEVRLNARR